VASLTGGLALPEDVADGGRRHEAVAADNDPGDLVTKRKKLSKKLLHTIS